MQRKIFKTGHSFAITISKKLLLGLGLKPGDSVKVELDGGSKRLLVSAGKSGGQLALNIRSRPRLGDKLTDK